eukprot:4315507-Amphidinium_carterae.1
MRHAATAADRQQHTKHHGTWNVCCNGASIANPNPITIRLIITTPSVFTPYSQRCKSHTSPTT